MVYYECNGGGNSGSTTVGELLFHADDNSVRDDSVGVRNNLTITQGSKFSEYLSYDSTTGRFTALKDCSLVVVMYLYNNPSSSNNPKGGIFVNGNIAPNDAVICSEYVGCIAGNSGQDNRSGSYRFISLSAGDYFTLNTVDSTGWAVVGAYGYLFPYFDKTLLTKYADS